MTAPTPTPLIAISTEDAPEDPFGYFRDSLSQVYRGISPRPVEGAPFRADVLAYAFDDAAISRMRATGHSARRDRHGITSEGDDALFLNLAADAPSRLDHLGRRTLLRPGQAVLFDNSVPFELALADRCRFSLYSIRMPRRMGGRELLPSDVAEANRRLADPALGRLTALLALLRREFDAMRLPVAGALLLAVRAMLDDMLRPEDPGARGALGPDPSSAPAFDAITAVALDRLDDPDFDLAAVARAVGRSPRTVQAAFAAAGTTWSRWALAARLDRARERIASPAWTGRPLAAIALASGLRDPSRFHRAFRARFDAPPAEFRPAPPGSDLSRRLARD